MQRKYKWLYVRSCQWNTLYELKQYSSQGDKGGKGGASKLGFCGRGLSGQLIKSNTINAIFFLLLLKYVLDFEYNLHFLSKLKENIGVFLFLADLLILLTRFSILPTHFL